MFKRFVLIFMVLFFSMISAGYTLDKVDINNAGVESLMTLKGVGEKYANRIIDYRKKNGPFKSVDDLTNIKGIGKKIVKMNKEMIVIKIDKKD